jgi:UDP-N-acetylglucosamine 4,6-dehydratase/5-epimerase
MFDNKIILITGGTGSFGKAFVKRLLKFHNPKKVIIFSRDEMKQWNMANEFKNVPKLRFFIGDVRDRDRLYTACKGVDLIVHAAATKIVPTAEYNPFECIKTNVNGAMNVIDAALANDVEKVVALSTDKASSPINLYGASKLASDKLFIASNSYSGDQGCRFSVVRYGNVMGSRGSVIPFFLSLKPDQPYPITDDRMTRFMISLDQGIDLVQTAFETAVGGEIFVKKIPSMNILDILKSVNQNAEHKIIGIRPGEKIHEQMIGVEDAPFTYEYNDYFKILPSINYWHEDKNRIADGRKVSGSFEYNSGTNTDWMSVSELQKWIKDNSSDINGAG